MGRSPGPVPLLPDSSLPDPLLTHTHTSPVDFNQRQAFRSGENRIRLKTRLNPSKGIDTYIDIDILENRVRQKNSIVHGLSCNNGPRDSITAITYDNNVITDVMFRNNVITNYNEEISVINVMIM